MNLYPEQYQHGDWIVFTNEIYTGKWCQPDAWLFLPDQKMIVVVEVKLQHTSDSWWQLVKLYIPLIEHLYPGWQVVGCEVTKWFNPDTVFPCPIKLCPRLEVLTPGCFGVHIYKPSRVKLLGDINV